MKHKHIMMGILVVSLMAITFVSTATAAQYFSVMTGLKAGKDFSLTINTSSGTTKVAPIVTISSFGKYVDTSSIVITIYDSKNAPTIINPDWTRISVSPDGNSILVQLVKQDGLPSHASAINAVGNLLIPYAGDTFFASGPGWGWANIHQ